MTILKIKDWILKEDSKSLILDEDNLQLWKKVLNKTMFEIGDVKNYSDLLWDQNWLEGYIGMTPYEAVMEEIEHW